MELVADGKKNLLDAEQTKVDLRLLMKALRDYTDIRQLTPEIVNALIRRIEVHSKDKEPRRSRWIFTSQPLGYSLSYGKRDAVSNGRDPPKPAAVQISCIKQNTVQPLFRDCTVSCIKASLSARHKSLTGFFTFSYDFDYRQPPHGGARKAPFSRQSAASQFFRLCSGAGMRPPRAMKSVLAASWTGITGAEPNRPPSSTMSPTSFPSTG